MLRSHLLGRTAGSSLQASCFFEIPKPQPCGSLHVSSPGMEGFRWGGVSGSGASSGPVLQFYDSAPWLDLSVQ